MRRIFYFLLTVLLSIYSIHAQVTVPGTPVTPQVSTKDQTNWYLLMSTTNEGTGQNDRYCRFLQWNGTRLITNQYVDGLSEDQITDNYRWCLEDAGNGNVYIRNAANNLRITVPSSITGNAGGRTNLTMTSEGSIFRWGLSKNEANAPSTCAENQYIFSYTGYTAGNNAYINSMNNAPNESDNPFGITIWSGGIDGASGWFFYPAAKPERTVTVVSNNEDMGTVSIQGHGSATITTSENVTVEATAKSGYEFVNWTKDGGTEVSSDNPYTYSGKEGINLTANFREKTYPLMKRYYTNGIDQQNRYLKKVSYTVNDIETTIFEANKQDELPYTKVTATSETTSGAVIDKTATKITLPGGTTQFSMSFNAWQEDIDGYTPQLEWTKQVYYIDLNQDFEFSGTNEETPALGRIPNGHADGNNFGDLNGNYNNGWATNITLPADLTAGTYRMRVVYFEPSGNDGDTWNDNNVKTYASLGGKLRNGIAYDFDIVIEGTEPTGRMVTVKSANETMGTVAITNPTTGVTDNSVTTADDVTVQATANSGYEFIKWTIVKTGGATNESTDNPYTYTDSEEATITATFQKTTVPLGVNKTWSSTLPGYVNGHKNGFTPEMNCARIEVDDNIIKVDGTRSNNISMAAWVKIIETNQDVSQAGSEKNYYGSSGVILMGHRQPQVFGYGGAPSFSLSFKDESKLAIFSRAKVDNGYPDDKAQTSETFDIEYGKWIHIAFTAALTEESTSETTAYKPVYTAYINGKKVCEMTMTEHTDPQLPFLPDTHNGQETVFVFGEGINAQFDNIMIWNKNISESEVKESMKGYANPSSVDGLVGYYTLDELNEDGTSPNILGGSENMKYSKIEIEKSINDINIHLGRTWGPNDAANASKVFLSKGDVESKVADITAERPEPQGGAKFFRDGNEIQTSEWELNGNEEFGYIQNLEGLTRLDYNGIEKVNLADGVLAVYHNGDAELPTYVKEEDLESMTGAKTEMTSSYVVAGLDYTVQMPAVAKQWMPISMPAEVDLIAVENGNGVRPGKNFWYAEPVVTGKNVTWTDITDEGNTDGTSYLNNLNPGIISVPESRVDQRFTFFTALGTPVVMRAYNQAYAAAQMPQAGVLKFVANPYATTVRAAQLTGEAANMTIYRMNTASGNFDPVEGTVTLKEFEPVFVFNNGGNPSMAPRYIGTKDVSGVLEVEAVYDVNVSGTQGAIEIKTFVPTEIEIFTINGTLVAASEVNGTHSFTLEAGIYIVRTIVEGNAKTFKVIVG